MQNLQYWFSIDFQKYIFLTPRKYLLYKASIRTTISKNSCDWFTSTIVYYKLFSVIWYKSQGISHEDSVTLKSSLQCQIMSHSEGLITQTFNNSKSVYILIIRNVFTKPHIQHKITTLCKIRQCIAGVIVSEHGGWKEYKTWLN